MGVVVGRRRACAVGFRAGGRVGSALHSPSAPPPHHSSPPHSNSRESAFAAHSVTAVGVAREHSVWPVVVTAWHVMRVCCVALARITAVARARGRRLAQPRAAVLRPPCCPPTAATSLTHSNARHSLNSTRHTRSHLRLSLATHPPPLPACMPLLLSPSLLFRLHAHARAAAHVEAGEGVQAGVVQGVAAGARREGKLRQLLRGGGGVFSFYTLHCNWRSLLRWVDWGECAWGSERGVRGAMVDVAWCMQDAGHMPLGEEPPACTSHPHALHMRGPLAAPLLLSHHHSLLRPAYHPPANACPCECVDEA
ncbi:unnamed protein product [Closterium sp. Naga37s-1]|nr:unnamed protein product [Closterium sp. Naga37s-1]